MNGALLELVRTALQESCGVRTGETVLIVEDQTLSPQIGGALATAAWALGADAMRLSYPTRQFLSFREFGLFAGSSLDPVESVPKPVLSALAAADVSVIINSDMSIMFDPAFREVAAGSQKLIWVPYLDHDSFFRLLPQSGHGWHALVNRTQRVAEMLRSGADVVVRTGSASNLTMSIGTYRVNCGTGVPGIEGGYGGLEIWPGGQVSTVPNPGSANGELVVDRSVNVPEFRELLDLIRLTVENGYVVDIAGDVEARRFSKWIESLDDPEAYHLTELGVGTNPACKFAGVAAPCEDTHALGCVSLALGADVHLGGVTKSKCHVDMTMHAASLDLDGRAVVDSGSLAV